MDWARRHLPGHHAPSQQPVQPPVQGHHGMHMPHMPHWGHHQPPDVSGTYATNLDDSLVTVCQTVNSLSATCPHSDWQAASGTINGNSLTMTFPGFPPVNGTVGHGRIAWENGVEWTVQPTIDLTGTYTTNRDDGHLITVHQNGNSITATSPQESWSPATGAIQGRNVTMTFPGFATVHGAWANGLITWSGDATGIVWGLMDPRNASMPISSVISGASQLSAVSGGSIPSYGSTYELPGSPTGARPPSSSGLPPTSMPPQATRMSSQISNDTFVPHPNKSSGTQMASAAPPTAAPPPTAPGGGQQGAPPGKAKKRVCV